MTFVVSVSLVGVLLWLTALFAVRFTMKLLRRTGRTVHSVGRSTALPVTRQAASVRRALSTEASRTQLGADIIDHSRGFVAGFVKAVGDIVTGLRKGFSQ